MNSMDPLPAVVIIAHDKPRQLRRLIDAVDPLPVFLHIDANTAPELHARMVEGLPARVRHLPRWASGWAGIGLVEAELSGYRAALAETDAEHIAFVTGADYPLVSVEDLRRVLASRRGTSFVDFFGFPKWTWPPLAGYDRVYFRNRAEGRRRVISPRPRFMLPGLRPAGGSQLKILSRRHAERLLHEVDSRPEILEFFRDVWAPDEVLVPTVLTSPAVSPHWDEEVAWRGFYIKWGRLPRQSPPWLELSDFAALKEAREAPRGPALFARKFADDSDALIERIDAELRTVTGLRAGA